MTELAPIEYTEEELRSYLPSGWNLVGSEGGSWDPGKKVWTARIEDTADMRWDLQVKAPEVSDKGRLEALRLAVDKLYRDRLGKRTRGLGL